jgi:hypothetical protein
LNDFFGIFAIVPLRTKLMKREGKKRNNTRMRMAKTQLNSHPLEQNNNLFSDVSKNVTYTSFSPSESYTSQGIMQHPYGQGHCPPGQQFTHISKQQVGGRMM